MTAPGEGCSCDRFGAVDCTSCRLCEDLCPPGLDLARVVVTSRRIRAPDTSHQDLFTSLASLEAQGAEGALGEWHATRVGVETGTDVVFFPGTAALLDVFFRWEGEFAAGPHAGLLLLNAAGVTPTVVGGGSGHDLYYQGRLEEFEALGRRLVPRLGEALDRTGGGPVVCASAEDAHALRDLHGIGSVHISEFLQGREVDLPQGVTGTGTGTRPKVAFFDPCRLGRYRGAYDAPRELLARVADVVEMGHARGEEPCCGVSAWVNCNAWSKDHREGILRKAHEVGAEVLVTACPMCQVHLECYYAEEAYDPKDPARVPSLRVADLAELVAELGGLRPEPGRRLERPSLEASPADAGILRPVAVGPLEAHLGDDVTRAAHLCTLCLRCVHECPQDAPVLEHVMRVRRALHWHGRSPPAVAAMTSSIEEHGNPFDEPRDRRTEAFPPTLEARAVTGGGRHGPEVLLFVGCVMSYQDPRGIGAVTRVMNATGIAYSVLGLEEACCGYMAHLAGADEAFAAIARERVEQFREAGTRLLVTPCPGCLRTFAKLYPEAVPGWPGEVEIVHLADFLDRQSGRGALPLKEGVKRLTVAYHDPCDLGRHFGVYDAPRRILAGLPGVDVVEFPDNRETAMCCGGGGGLRTFDNTVSQDIGVRRLESLPEGVDAVVTACPSCKGNLRLSATRLVRGGGPRLRVLDINEVVASRLDGGEGG